MPTEESSVGEWVLPVFVVIDTGFEAEGSTDWAVQAFVDREYAVEFIKMAHEARHPRAHLLRMEEFSARRADKP